MKLYAVTMVKDEEDVIKYTILNMFRQNVEKVIVADNLSTDNTRSILEELARDYDIEIVDDLVVGYYQAQKMTNLTKKAFAQGADWVIPFDADEVFVSDNGSLRSLLDSVHVNVGICHFKIFNYFPMPTDDLQEVDPLARIVWRDALKAPLSKVVVRNAKDIEIFQGNHGAISHWRTETIAGSVCHFPWRSFEQFTKKVVNGHKAYKASSLPDQMGEHWRNYGDILERGGLEALREVYQTWFYNPSHKLVLDPVYNKFG